MKVTMQPAISLDGFIAKLNGDSVSWVNPADEARYQAEVKRCGSLIVGRTTYEQYREDFKVYGSDVRLFVCTSDKSQKSTDNVIYVNGSAEEIIKNIAGHGYDELVVCGGGEVNGMLAKAGLKPQDVLDELARREGLSGIAEKESRSK